MATSNRRDVRLGVGIEIDGEEQIADLGAQLRKAAAAGGEMGEAAAKWAARLDEATAATRAARDAERERRTESSATRKALDDARDALARHRAESTAATRTTNEYQQAETRLKLAVIDTNKAHRDARASLTASTAEARNAAAAQSALADQIRRSSVAQVAAVREQSGALEGLKSQLTTLRNIAGVALGGSLLGSLARDVGETADAVANLRARLQLVVGEGPALEAAYEGVLAVAQRTGSALESTATLFTRIMQAGKVSQRDALALTESIGQAIAVSGTAAASSEAAITQLIQGLQSGVLRGEEFNSMMEQAPRLARALADGLGLPTGALREMAQQGALTTEVVLTALRGQSATLQAEFDKLPATIGRAITNLGTAWSVYVGEADRATGASKIAAGAIDALAKNLDSVIGLLYAAGKAAAAYTALRLAESFIASATAARTAAVATAAATAATTAHTAATTANTTAQAANAAASAGSVAAAGRLAGVLSTLKTFSFLAVVTNLQSIGEWLGETAAKWMGYGKAIDDAERSQRANEAAARANAAALEAAAQATERATDKSLGLEKQSKALVSQFDGLVTKGETVADALGKIGKELDLSDVRGITTAGAALDALAVRGKVTADQLQETLGAALKGLDLGVFETQARAAFTGSEQGARRLAAALDALADESLRRAGSSARELGTGFSEAAASAINDLDSLGATLDRLGVKGDAAGRLLAKSVDQALAAANTERAVQALLTRVEALGAAGTLTGDRLADALGKARAKLDDLRGGVNSLDEALRVLGLKTRAELQATADKLGEAYTRVAGNAQVSLQDQAKAYGTWRDAALAATGGVESGQLKLQGTILANRIAALGLGDGIEQAMRKGARATDTATSSQERYNAALRADPSRMVGGNGLGGIKSGGGDQFKGFKGSSADTFNSLYNATPDGGITREGGGMLQPPDNSGDYYFNTSRRGEGPFGLGVWELTPEGKARRDAAGDALTGPAARARDPGGMNGSAGYSPFGSHERSKQAPPLQPIVINLPGRGSVTVNADSRRAADELIALLEQSQKQAGG